MYFDTCFFFAWVRGVSSTFHTFLTVKILYNMDDEKTNNFEAVLSAVIAGMGQVNITNFSKNLISSLKGAIDAWSSIDEPAKELFRTTFVGIFTVIEECTKLVIMQDKDARQKKQSKAIKNIN